MNMSLSECVSRLPHAPGVYFFHGDSRLPLYIGKSVDIRARVMSHLRNPEEERMLAQTRHIDCIETAGEIGALLLESHLIKTRSPLFNQRLRRTKQLFTIELHADATGFVPKVMDGRQVQHGVSPGLYGLFASTHAAKQKLHALASQHRLCMQLLGLETPSTRGCFGWQTKQCAGACVGQEPRLAHDQRLRDALQAIQIHTWPFAGAVHLVERREQWVQKHKIHNWAYQGTSCSRQTLNDVFGKPTPLFDADTYQILVKPLLLNQVEIELLSATS